MPGGRGRLAVLGAGQPDGRRATVDAAALDPLADAAVVDCPDVAESANRRRIWHDIHHELATIALLAAVVGEAADVGAASRARAAQIQREARWLEELLRAYAEATPDPPPATWSPPAERIRVDRLAGEVVAALRLTSMARVRFEAVEVWTYGNRLALWRALRNLMDNAFRAAGPQGSVRVRIAIEGEWAVAQIDDDGPGFGAGPAGLASLGLGIVQDIAAERGGSLEIRTSTLGGGCVRVLLPAVSSPQVGDGTGG